MTARRLFSWKFFLHGVDPDYPVDYDGESWPAIAGHRDAATTECPGAALDGGYRLSGPRYER
jgi:hypothetical protein